MEEVEEGAVKGVAQISTTAFPTNEALTEQEPMVGVETAGVEGVEGEELGEVEEETQITAIATEHSATASKMQQQYNRTQNLVERASLVLA